MGIRKQRKISAAGSQQPMSSPEKGLNTARGRLGRPSPRAGAFSLVELLTVIFIISLLIGILIPSIHTARNAAKRLTTRKAMSSIEAGLEMFKNENGAEFPHTNGYPPSFCHPPIRDYTFSPELGQFPFLSTENPVVYGAHWLPAMLIGVDARGFIPRKSVPREIRSEPWKWYTVDALGTGESITERAPLYVDPGNLDMRKTRELPGRPNTDLFPSWSDDDEDPKAMQNLPVIVDAFDQAILYYAANTHGRPTNMVEDDHKADNNYLTGTPQADGPPFYFQQDNIGFTGRDDKKGWDYGAVREGHPLAKSGALYRARDIVEDTRRESFATYIIDRKIYASLAGVDPDKETPLRPVNPDSYLLISAGVDGRYGTVDDVSNIPPWPE